jgi:hypothetical protein
MVLVRVCCGYHVRSGGHGHLCGHDQRPGGLGHGVWSGVWSCARSAGDMRGRVRGHGHGMVACSGATRGEAGPVMVCGPACTVTTCGLVCGTSGRAGTVMVRGCVCGGCHLRLEGHGHGHGVVACVGDTSGRVGTVIMCGLARSVTTCGLADMAPAAGGHGHSVRSHAWPVGVTSGRVGSVMVRLHVRASPAAGWARSWCVVRCVQPSCAVGSA